jgi:transcriptional regulator with AAA-type ATPase domain
MRNVGTMVATRGDTLEDEGSSSGKLWPATAHLFVVLECDRPAAGGARYSLGGIDEISIERGSERSVTRERSGTKSRLVLKVPGKSLSSKHARLVDDGARWVLEDNQSKNGSYLNGVRVTRAAVADGDLIEVGHTILSLRLALPTPTGTPLDWDGQEESSELPPTLLPLFAHELGELAKLAELKVPIVVVGETGTGKEVLARALHRVSKRPGRFVAVNCGALAPSLVEGQLFGHVRGAFSGAVTDQLGFVREADGGTLLLDEIGDLPKPAQSTLLRVLQEGEVVPLGRARPVEVDLRVMAASQEPLDALVAAGQFRADLRARLEGFVVHLPNLRERREDLGMLVAALAAKVASEEGVSRAPGISFKPDAGRVLCMYEWPLNIRELEQCVTRALALAIGAPVGKNHLPAQIAGAVHRPTVRFWEDDELLRKELVTKLEEHDGNVANVARALGRARMQVHRWMARLAIDPNDFRKAK